MSKVDSKTPQENKVLVILGPTASGKSELGVRLAKQLNGEIISADSRQVYRGLNIGTGKITEREMRGVPHHLLDVADPKKLFSVARYQKLGRMAIKEIAKKGKLPIIVGGTGLYIDALIYNYPLPAVKPNLVLRKRLEKLSTEELFLRLRKLDMQRAKHIDSRNRRRLVRALEILAVQRIPSASSVLKKTSPYSILKIGIRKEPAELKRLIYQRLQKRLRQGLVKEVENLLEKKVVNYERLESLGLEYRYVSRYLRGEMSKPEMIQKLETEIYRYAKRQMTWFKRDLEIQWFDTRDIHKLPQYLLVPIYD